MGPFIFSNSGHTAYGVKEYICDTNADVDLLPLDDTPGSSALVIDSGDLYILNSKHEWKRQGGGNSSGGEGGSSVELEAKIKELEEQQTLLQEQVSQLTVANKELTNEIEKLRAEIEGEVIVPEEETIVEEETGTMIFNEENTEVREDGTFVLK